MAVSPANTSVAKAVSTGHFIEATLKKEFKTKD
jgi:hypothetical protein